MIEFGTILGSIIFGKITDMTRTRSLYVPILLFIVALDFYLLSFVRQWWVIMILMGIEGLFIGGPYMVISAAIASDLVDPPPPQL